MLDLVKFGYESWFIVVEFHLLEFYLVEPDVELLGGVERFVLGGQKGLEILLFMDCEHDFVAEDEVVSACDEGAAFWVFLGFLAEVLFIY